MIMTITFVTGNQTKILHANEALLGIGYSVAPRKLDMIESREEEPEKVVVEKALQAFRILNEPLIVEDSGLFIRALNGFPKTFVNFAVSTIGVANILKMMEGVDDRYVEFRQSLAYIEPGMTEPKVFSYIDGGYVLADSIWDPKYADARDFDKILIPPGQKKPLCTFSREWRAQRDAAANRETIHYRQLARWLSSR
jgi:XTP/dITP diphosphohydrolase